MFIQFTPASNDSQFSIFSLASDLLFTSLNLTEMAAATSVINIWFRYQAVTAFLWVPDVEKRPGIRPTELELDIRYMPKLNIKL